jgi:hypothetical protein
MLEPKAVQDVLLASWPAWLKGSSWRVSLRAAEGALPTFVHRYHVSTILVDEAGRHPRQVVRMFTAVYGRPYRYGSLLIWNLRRGPVHAAPGRRSHARRRHTRVL